MHGEEQSPGLSPVQRERVMRALDEVMQSGPMRTTLQCQTLLQYIVEHTLSGETSLLRERVIGKEVFGRRPDYEPGEDPVVRIRAADLRKRLALYYQSLSSTPDVRIDVPSGSYRANFIWKESEVETAVSALAGQELQLAAAPPATASTSEVAAVHPLESAPRLDRKVHLTIVPIAIAVLFLLAALSVALFLHGKNDRMLRAVWGPLLDSPKPILISIGSNAVYRVSDDKADEYSRENHLENSGMEFFPHFSSTQTYGSTGLQPAENSFVALGDVATVSEVVATLAHFSKTFQERFPNDISFAEVRSNPTVLIGGFNNSMTRELSRNLRFVLAARNRIEDRNQPGKVWELHASTDSHDTEDYAIVTRILRHDEVEPMIIVAGMGQYGTLAATDFICQPKSLDELSRSLGGDWQKQNFQMVLRIKVIDFKPVSTSIIATYVW
ncbi:hypothetical protein SAMN05421771_2383 [Granulicella pectinivorans]|uniref:Adenylate cyclase n=2 Tax=Granulicella pectinivorans TaxID=474950 RepID=A0A1I6MDB6_9BACT|nr:hypothetical protein SAMN05421771_2383 [Granulicella pectinivorans]